MPTANCCLPDRQRQVFVGERKNVLLVPNAALRWTPQPDQIAAEFRRAASEGARQAERRRGQAKPAAAGRRPGSARGVVWVPEGSLVRPRLRCASA